MESKKNGDKFLFFLIIVLAPIGQAAIDIFVTALPEMRTYYEVSQANMQLSVSMYLIAFAVGQMFYGPISDAKGRKNTLLFGVSLYLIGSVLAVLSEDFTVFIFARIIQGLGITSASVVMKAIAVDRFQGEKLGVVLTYMVISWGMGPIVAPVIGANIQTLLGWKYCLIFLSIYGIGLFTYLIFFKESLKEPIPLVPSLLFSNGKQILMDRRFQLCFLSMGLCYGVLLTFNLVAPFMVQETLGYSPRDFGNIALAMGAAYFFGVFINRFNKGRIALEKLFFISVSINLMASIIMLVLSLVMEMNLQNLIAPCLIMTFFSGVMYPNIMGKGVSLYPKLSGLASSLLGFLLMLIAGLIMIMASFLDTTTLTPLAIMLLVINTLCFIFIKALNGLENLISQSS